MIITLGDLAQIKDSVGKLVSQELELTQKEKWNMALAIKEMNKNLTEFQTQHLEILKKYKIEVGAGYFNVKDFESEELYMKELKELETVDVDIAFPQVKYSKVADKLTASDISKLMDKFLINDME